MRADLPVGSQGGPVRASIPEADWNGLAIVGDAPTRYDVIAGHPFSGPPGAALESILGKLGLDRREVLLTNCFAHQPAWSATVEGRRRNNDIRNFFTLDSTLANLNLPAYRGRYLLEEVADDLRNTWRLLREVQPKVIVAMGSTALWALAHLDNVGQNRGQQLATRACDAPLLATYHPSSTLSRKNATLLDRIEEDLRAAIAIL